jgi:hypothetical protein
MSILGFNFSFGARDDGFANALSKAGAGVKGLSAQVSSLADKVTGGSFFNAMNTLQLDQIGDQLSALKGQGQQLETSLEGNFRNMSAEVRPMLAQMGLTQEEFKKATSEITSTAYGLNVGAGEVAESFRAIRRAGDQTQDVFKKMGIGMKEMTLIGKATGLGVENISGLVRGLTESYAFNTDEASAFLDNFTRLSQELGIADISFGSLSGLMEDLDDTLSSNTEFMAMNREEQVKYVEEQVMGVQRLTKAFMGLGKTPEEAQAAAASFFKTISSERKGVNGMMIGLGDMGETFKALAQESGLKGVEGLFATISSSPTEALAQIVQMQGELAKAGDAASLARFNEKLQQMLGGLAFMKDAGKGFTQRLNEVNAAAGKTGDGLLAMSKKAHTANRSIDEVLQMAEDQFDTRMMKLAGGARANYAKAQINMYKQVYAEAEKLSSNTVWGPLFKQFIAARKIGARAFFQPVERDSKQLSHTLSGIGDAVGKGGILGRLGAIKTLGITGFFLDFNDATLTSQQRLEKAEKAAEGYYNRLEALGLGVDTLRPALVALGTAFASLFVLAKVASSVASLVSVFGSLGGAVFGALGVLKAAVVAIVGSPVVIAAAVVAGIAAIGYGIQKLAAMPAEVFQGFADSIDGLGGYLDEMFINLMDIDVVALTNSVIDQMIEWAGATFKGIATLFDPSGGKSKPVFEAIARLFGKIGMVSLAGIVKLGEVFLTVGSRVAGWLGEGFSYAWSKVDEYVLEPIGRIASAIGEAFGTLYEALTAPFRAIAAWWRDFSIARMFTKYIIAPLAAVMDGVANMFFDFANIAFFKPIEMLVNKLGDIISYFYQKMPTFITSRLDKMGLKEIGEKGFQADFTIKREGGDSAFYDSVMAPVIEAERKIEVAVSQDGMERRQDETNSHLRDIAEALKSRPSPGGLQQAPVGVLPAPRALK